ncbi:MAG: hypothetical protein WC825_12930 [Gallionellaceae bacterium]|jgi:hypothetical protein
MSYLLSILAVLVIGVIILMVGVLMNREPGQSFNSSLNDSMTWGVSFVIAFGGEFMLLANV